MDGEGYPGAIGGDRLARKLREIRNDSSIHGVVLRVNSPGGSAMASELIQREIILLKKEKPVVVSLGTYAASGGYWIAAYGDELYTDPFTLTGSIGVWALLPNIQDIAENHGLDFEEIQTGKLANLLTLTRPKTEAELAQIKRFTDRIYDEFIKKVSEARGIERKDVNELAQGRIWTGQDALRLKLADKEGGLSDAIAATADRLSLDEDEYGIVQYPKEMTFEESLAELLAGGSGQEPLTDVILPLEVQKLKRQVDKQIKMLKSGKHIYARLPWVITNSN